MSTNSDRFPYLTSTVLTQEFLDACHDSLTNQLELVVDIESPDGSIIRASDRNKYVGSIFYEALLVFPVIRRTVGEWLVGTLEFSTLELQLANVDGRFNNVLPAGADFSTWIGRAVTVKLGLRDVASTYTRIFQGTVTDAGGFGRDVRSIRLVARDDADKTNKTFPPSSFIRDDFADIEDEVNGKGQPVIYGDWTTAVNPRGASVPATLVNGRDPYVHFQEVDVQISVGSPAIFSSVRHRFEDDDIVNLTTDGTLPLPFIDSFPYYVVGATENTFQLAVTSGGASINSIDAGSGTFKVIAESTQAHKNLQLWVSGHALTSLDTANIWLYKGTSWIRIPETEIENVAGDFKSFELKQNTATLWLEGAAYLFERGDTFFVKCVGHNLAAYSSNGVGIAKDILKRYGGLVDGSFDANWGTYADKAAPAESAVASIPVRHWQQESANVLEVALSILEQIRLEAFIDRSLLWKINALHFDEFQSSPSFTVRNWDVVRDTFKPTIDQRNNFNRAKGVYNRLPDSGENTYETAIFKNTAAITAAGKDISKQLVFPNLYNEDTVVAQVKEMLKLASAYFEVIEVELTWRTLLLDIGDWVSVDVQIQSTQYSNVPAVIREIGYDPNGLKIPVKLWSMQMTPFAGWSPGYAGITGGTSATIDQE